MKYLGESYFNSYLYRNKNLLEETMNFNIKNIELEKNIGIGYVRKVDISGTSIDNKIFLGEVQLGSAVGDISFRISVNKKNIVIALIFSGQMKNVFVDINEEFKSKNDLEKDIKVDEKYSKFYMEIEKDKNFYNVALEFKKFYCYFK